MFWVLCVHDAVSQCNVKKCVEILRHVVYTIKISKLHLNIEYTVRSCYDNDGVANDGRRLALYGGNVTLRYNVSMIHRNPLQEIFCGEGCQ